MAGITLGPDHDLAKRLTNIENRLDALSTQASYVELAARKTYAASNPGFNLTWNTSPGTPVTDMGVTLNFTLDQQRAVLFIGTTSIDSIAGDSQMLAQTTVNVNVPGYYTESESVTTVFSMSTSSSGEVRLQVVINQVFIVPAGDVTASMTAQGLPLTSQASSEYIGAALVAMVLGPA